MAVGASTCASGSQVWNGNAGILIAKPIIVRSMLFAGTQWVVT